MFSQYKFGDGNNDGKIKIVCNDGQTFQMHKSVIKNASKFCQATLKFNKTSNEKKNVIIIDNCHTLVITIFQQFYDGFNKVLFDTIDSADELLEIIDLIQILDLNDRQFEKDILDACYNRIRQIIPSMQFEDFYHLWDYVLNTYPQIDLVCRKYFIDNLEKHELYLREHFQSLSIKMRGALFVIILAYGVTICVLIMRINKKN